MFKEVAAKTDFRQWRGYHELNGYIIAFVYNAG